MCVSGQGGCVGNPVLRRLSGAEMGIKIGWSLVGKQVLVWGWKVLLAQRELAVKSWPEVRDDPMEVEF